MHLVTTFSDDSRNLGKSKHFSNYTTVLKYNFRYKEYKVFVEIPLQKVMKKFYILFYRLEWVLFMEDFAYYGRTLI